MNIRDFKEGFQINKEFLDTIDFIPFLEQYDRLGEMMIAVEEKYHDINMPVELDRELFNYYDEYDFKEYLKERYKNNIEFFPIEDYVIEFWENNKGDIL